MTTLMDGLAEFMKTNGYSHARPIGDVTSAFFAGASVMAEQFARADLLSSLHNMAEMAQLRASSVYVWSFQRMGWWKINECGYAAELVDAGKYSFPRAWEICMRANVRHVQEAIVPVNPLWLEYGLPAGPPGAPE